MIIHSSSSALMQVPASALGSTFMAARSVIIVLPALAALLLYV